MLPPATTYDDAVESTALDAELKREMEKLENEAFAFLEIFLESDEDPSNFYDLLARDANTLDLIKQEDERGLKLWEDEGFALLESLVQDEDKPSVDGSFDRGIVVPSHSNKPIDFPDQQEMEKLEEEAFELLDPVLEEGAESSVHSDLFVRATVACEQDARPQQWHRPTKTRLDLRPTEVLVNLLPSAHNVKILKKKEGTFWGRMLQRIRAIIGR